jgi:serine/threonine-protein kinase
MSTAPNPGLPEMSGSIADYRVTGHIGRGRLGTVYLAQDERMNRIVALKVLVPPPGDDAFRIRFLRAAEGAATLGHPGIIPVYEVGDAGENLFIAMHYAQGGDAGSLLLGGGPLAPAAAWGIIAQIASALDAAHSHGLVHGDVKPSNLLLEAGERAAGPGPEATRVYLADFGLAPGVQPAASPSAGQYAAAACYDYMAPEQALGQSADGRADLYSLACVGYELLCGTPPFGRGQGTTARYAHMHARPPTVTAQRPDLPAEVDIVLATALAKDPADRYPACTPFAQALRIALRPAASEPARQPASETRPAKIFAPVLVGPGGREAQPEADGPQASTGPDGPQFSSQPELPKRVPGSQGIPGRPRSAPRRASGTPGTYPGPDDPFPGDEERYPGPGQPHRTPGDATRQFPAPGPYPEPPAQSEEPFPGPAGWFREAASPDRAQTGWFREPGGTEGDQAGRYPGPGEQYGGPGGRPPQAGRPGGGRKLVLAATAVTVVIVGVTAGIVLSRSTSGHQPSPQSSGSASPTTSAVASGQATAINNVLSSSAAARQSLPGAVSDVLHCTNLPGALAQFQGVVSQRSGEVRKASSLSVSALVNGAAAKSDLVAALRSSLAADRDYLSWAQRESTGCKPGAQSSAHQAALAEDSQATNAKQAFVAVWNPIAASYGLPPESASSF